jgi:hypothetical protein
MRAPRGRAVCDAALSKAVDVRVAVTRGDRRRVADDTTARRSVAVTLPVSRLKPMTSTYHLVRI